MPELPEVETIARSLRSGGRCGPSILGHTVTGGQVLWPRTLAALEGAPQGAPTSAAFAARVAGQAVCAVGRRAKYLVLTLSQDSLLIHLRMSGDLRVEPARDAAGNALPLQPHDRLVLDLGGGGPTASGGASEVAGRLAFNDARKFGRVWLLADPQAVLGALGPEPFDPALTAEVFTDRLHRANRQIKPLLLDQTFLAGLGNIYTDEALFLAGIHPLRLSRSILPEQAARLLESIRTVLTEGIRRNGASIDWVYRGGDFQNHFQVYQRTGEACPRCGGPVVRITVGQRGTHFCPTCQV